MMTLLSNYATLLTSLAKRVDKLFKIVVIKAKTCDVNSFFQLYPTGYAEKSSINLDHDNSFFKERSGREGMTGVSVLLGAAVEVGVGSNPTIAK